jgi:plasmid stabilization system protein ParE
MAVVWRTKALAGIAPITAYIAADNPVAAARIARALETGAILRFWHAGQRG